MAGTDFAADKKQKLEFTDTEKIDANYKVVSIPIALTGDGEVNTPIACTAAGKCNISLTVSTGS